MGDVGKIKFLSGDLVSANDLFQQQLNIYRAAFEKTHGKFVEPLAWLSLVNLGSEKLGAALIDIRAATGIARDKNEGNDFSIDLGSPGFDVFSLHSHIAFVSGLNKFPSRNDIHSEAFNVVQYSAQSKASDALTQTASRIAAGSSDLAIFVRKLQDLKEYRRALDEKILTQLAEKKSSEKKGILGRLKVQMTELDAKLSSITQILAARFPRYSALTNPKPLRVSEAQSLLEGNEVLVVYQGGVDGRKVTLPGYAWVVRRDGFRMFKLDIGEGELSGLVSVIRSSFSVDGEGTSAFPYGAAHELYRKIFAPLEKDLEGIKHVMIVPDGPLTSLPLSVLLRKPYEGKGTPDWLANKYAVTTLPAVSSLRALRGTW